VEAKKPPAPVSEDPEVAPRLGFLMSGGPFMEKRFFVPCLSWRQKRAFTGCLISHYTRKRGRKEKKSPSIGYAFSLGC
jgi:hypothetical protein